MKFLSDYYQIMLSKYIKPLMFLLIFFVSINFFNTFAYAQSDEKLQAEIKLADIGWSFSEEEQFLRANLDIRVTYFGECPPMHVLLSIPLNDTDATYVAQNSLEMVKLCGPWIDIGNNIWILNKTRNEGYRLPTYNFPLKSRENWPNEKISVQLFFATTPRNINGSVNKIKSASLDTINSEPKDNFDYWLTPKLVSDSDVIILNGDTQTPDDPIGRFFDLVLSHEFSSSASFNYLPSLLTVIYPTLIFLIFLIDLVSLIKFFEALIKTLLTTILSLTVFLLNIQYWIKDYVPPWENKIFSSINSLLVWLLILLIFTFALSMVRKDTSATVRNTIKEIINKIQNWIKKLRKKKENTKKNNINSSVIREKKRSKAKKILENRKDNIVFRFSNMTRNKTKAKKQQKKEKQRI